MQRNVAEFLNVYLVGKFLPGDLELPIQEWASHIVAEPHTSYHFGRSVTPPFRLPSN